MNLCTDLMPPASKGHNGNRDVHARQPEQDADGVGDGEAEFSGEQFGGHEVFLGHAQVYATRALLHLAPSPGGRRSEPSQVRRPRGAGHPPHGVVYDRNAARAETERDEAPVSPRKPPIASEGRAERREWDAFGPSSIVCVVHTQ